MRNGLFRHFYDFSESRGQVTSSGAICESFKAHGDDYEELEPCWNDCMRKQRSFCSFGQIRNAVAQFCIHTQFLHNFAMLSRSIVKFRNAS